MTDAERKAAVIQVLQEVHDTPPWAYTYKERPDDLLEIRSSELEAILWAALEGPSPTDEIVQLRAVVSKLEETVLTLRLKGEL